MLALRFQHDGATHWMVEDGSFVEGEAMPDNVAKLSNLLTAQAMIAQNAHLERSIQIIDLNPPAPTGVDPSILQRIQNLEDAQKLAAQKLADTDAEIASVKAAVPALVPTATTTPPTPETPTSPAQ